MKKLCLCLVFVIFITGCHSREDDSIFGAYVNTNYELSSLVEVPSMPDTLILNSDSTFLSGYYGVGKYSVKKNNLKLEFLGGSYVFPIRNKISGETRFILSYDLNQYYKKLDH